jgi:hypothetical protein
MQGSRAIMAAVLVTLSSSNWASAAPKPWPENPRPPLGNNPNPVLGSPVNASPAPIREPQAPRPTLGSNPHQVSGTSTGAKSTAPPPQRQASPPANHSRQNSSNHDRDRRRDDRDRRHSYIPAYVYVPYYDDASMANAGQWWPNEGGQPACQIEPADPPEPRAGANRATNARSNSLAWKFIGYGDVLFAKQEYAQANDRYRKAAHSAPQLGAAWFRQGFALAAVGRCDLAAAAVKRGLKLDPAWPKSNFEIDQLFGANGPAKNAVLDALAAAAMAKPTDSDRLFILGVFLYFDGQNGRATTLFERAEQIAGDNVGHIEAFLEQE